MAGRRIVLLRPHDFLYLEIEPVNLQLKYSNRKPYLRKKRNQAAFLIVDFPPQHIAEDAAAADARSITMPVRSTLARPSRLVFSVPEEEEFEDRGIPYSVEGLLDWSRLDLAVGPVALPSIGAPPPDGPLRAGGVPLVAGPSILEPRPSPSPPERRETAIYLPAGLVISPHAWTRWKHALEAASKEVRIPDSADPDKDRVLHRYVLWHSAMAPSEGTGERRDLMTVRAISRSSDSDRLDNRVPNSDERSKLVLASAGFDADLKLPSEVAKYSPPAVEVRRLMLSSLGATTRLKARFDSLALKSSDISAWEQDVVWGRDQSALVQREGAAAPTGHLLSLVQLNYRKFGRGEIEKPNGKFRTGTAAHLQQRFFVTVKQPLLAYSRPADGEAYFGRALPFSSIRIEPSTTPDLQIPIDYLSLRRPPKDRNGAYVLSKLDAFVPVPLGSDQPFAFEVIATDHSGASVRFQMPLLWINLRHAVGDSNDGKSKLKAILEKYNSESQAHLTTASLGGQIVAFVPPQAKGDGDRDEVGMRTSRMSFGAQHGESAVPKFPPTRGPLKFYPAVREADVVPRGTDAISRQAPHSRVRYAELYRRVGFASENPSEVFLDAESALNFDGSRGGGLATPSMSIAHISRNLGPIGGSSPFAARASSNPMLEGRFDAREFFRVIEGFSEVANLLGGVPLSDVIGPVEEALDQLEKIPRLLVAETKRLDRTWNSIERKLTDARDSFLDRLKRPGMRWLLDLQSEVKGRTAVVEAQLVLARRNFESLLAERIPGQLGRLAETREFVVRKLLALQPPSSKETERRLADLRRAFSPVTVEGPNGESAESLRAAVDAFARELDSELARLETTFPVSAMLRELELVEQARGRHNLEEVRRHVTHLLSVARSTSAEFAGREKRELRRVKATTERMLASARLRIEAACRVLRDRVNAEVANWKGLKEELGEDLDRRLAGLECELLKEIEDKIRPLLLGANGLVQELERATGIMEQRAAELQGIVTDELSAMLDAVQAPSHQRLPRELSVSFEWEPELQDASVFVASLDGVRATFLLRTAIRQPIQLLGQSGGLAPPKVKVVAALQNFKVRLMPGAEFITVGFDGLRLESKNGSSPAFTARVQGVEFGEELSYVKELADALNPETGPYLELLRDGLQAGFRFELPTIGVGVFNLIQLSINAGVRVPYNGEEVLATFSIGRRERPFLMNVGVLGGGGFFSIDVGVGGLKKLECAFEFGAVVALNLGVAKGKASIVAGIYFSIGKNSVSLYGYFRASGSLNILGIITMSAEIYLALGYEKRGSRSYAVGEASVSFEIQILFLSFRVSVSVRREFGGNAEEQLGLDDSGGRTPEVFDRESWSSYKACFADW